MPLETLPGWPPAPPVSPVRELLLLIGFPLVMGLIIAGVAMLRPAKSAYDSMQEREALWVGSGAPEAVTEGPASRAALSADQSGSSQGGAAGKGSAGKGSADRGSAERGSADKGGASARW
jgi:hypothetical protein